MYTHHFLLCRGWQTADSVVTIHGLAPLRDTLTVNSADIENFQGRSRWTTEGDAQLVLWMNASITERQFEVCMSARNPNTASAGANLTVEALAHFRARGVSPIAELSLFVCQPYPTQCLLSHSSSRIRIFPKPLCLCRSRVITAVQMTAADLWTCNTLSMQILLLG